MLHAPILSTRFSRSLGQIWRLAIPVLLGFALVGCASAEVIRTPERAITVFSRALIERRPEVAYGLMAPSFRQQLDLESFTQRMQENEQESLLLADLLGRPPKRSAAANGSNPDERMLEYHGVPRPIRLELENDSYRICTPLLDFYNQDSPRKTLRSFLQAVKARRFDVVLRLMPNDDKFGLSQEDLSEAWTGDRRDDLERVLSNLQQALQAKGSDKTHIDVRGERATMTYAKHLQAELVREAGSWKIIAPE